MVRGLEPALTGRAYHYSWYSSPCNMSPLLKWVNTGQSLWPEVAYMGRFILVTIGGSAICSSYMTKHFPILQPGRHRSRVGLENKAQVEKMCKYTRLSTKQKDSFSMRKILLFYACSLSLLPLIVFIEVTGKLKQEWFDPWTSIRSLLYGLLSRCALTGRR